MRAKIRDEKEKSKEMEMFILIGIIVTVVIVYSLRDEEKFSLMVEDFSNPVFVSLVIIIIATTIWGVLSDNIVLHNAIQKGAIAFLTAYMSRLNMAVAIFYIIAIFVYYTN